MSDATTDPEGFNPYARPTADLTAPPVEIDPDLAEAERVRREYIGRETNIKSIGSLYILGAIGQGLALLGNLAQLSGVADTKGGDALALRLANAGVAAAMFALSAALAAGLRGLRSWARWTAAGLNGLGLVLLAGMGVVIAMMGSPGAGLAVFLIAGGITGAIVYLLASPRSSFVFTEEYREIIRRTPHVKYRTSWVALVALLAVLSLIVLAIVAGALMPRR